MMRQVGTCVITVLTILGHSQAVNAMNFSFTDTFSRDNMVQLFDFSLTESASVTVKTFSYAGGTQSDGNVVSDGGFDPLLALFDSAGVLIDQNDDGSPPNVAIDPVTGAASDAFLEVILDAGDYFVSLMQFDNFANGPNLSDGFAREGEGSYTGFEFGPGSGSFYDFDGNQRTNAWALDILNVSEADTIPEPHALSLFVIAFVTLWYFGRRGRRAIGSSKTDRFDLTGSLWHDG